jgi:hypothetical protein
MSESDLLKVSSGNIANPPSSGDMLSVLTAWKYTDGRSLLEGWRSEMKLLIAQIAAEKTWAMQRQRLIHFRVAATTWIALYKAVGVEPRIWLWRSYVERIDDFAACPENVWPALLQKRFYFAALQTAVLGALGMGCYGTGETLEHYLRTLRELRKHAIEKGVFLDRGILELDEVDHDLAESLLARRNGMIYPQNQKLFAFLQELGDRIETGAVQESEIENRWAELCNGLNEQVRALKHFTEDAMVSRLIWRDLHRVLRDSPPV